MTVTWCVSGTASHVSSAVSPKRLSVSPSVSASRGNSYQSRQIAFSEKKEKEIK